MRLWKWLGSPVPFPRGPELLALLLPPAQDESFLSLLLCGLTLDRRKWCWSWGQAGGGDGACGPPAGAGGPPPPPRGVLPSLFVPLLSSAASPLPAPSPSSASSSAALLPSLLSPSSPPPPSPNFTVILRERRGTPVRPARPGAAAKFSHPPPSQHGRRCLFQVLPRPARRRPAEPAPWDPEPRPGPLPGPRGPGYGGARAASGSLWPRPDGLARAAPQAGGVRVRGSRFRFWDPRVATWDHLPGGATAHGLSGEQPALRPCSPRCLGPLGLCARAPRPHPSPPL